MAQINIKVGSASGHAGDVVAIPFTFSGSAGPGLAAFDFRITYDSSRIVPVDTTPATPGSIGDGGIMIGPALPAGATAGDSSVANNLYMRYSLPPGSIVDVPPSGPGDTGGLHIFYTAPSFTSPTPLPAVAFTLQFQIKSSAMLGSAPIHIVPVGIPNIAPSPFFIDRFFSYITVGALVDGAVNVVAPAPIITSFTPSSGIVGAAVTISGQYFTGATSVQFNGVSASFMVVSDMTINATVPAMATTGLISVTTPYGSATSATNFTVIIAPTITSFSPTAGPIGTIVTIIGTNFTGTTTVAFNGAIATSFTVNSNTMITATVPSSATSGLITVTNAAGTATSAASFSVTTTINSQVSLTVGSTTYTAITDPNYVGTYAINVTVTNNGPTRFAPLYFQIVSLTKLGTDLDPSRPDKLISADNGAGVVGDIQTMVDPMTGMPLSAFIQTTTEPVTFTVGIGSRQSFNFLVNLYALGPSPSDNKQLLGQYEFDSDSLESGSSINRENIGAQAGGQNNMSLIAGPGAQSRPVVAIDPNNAKRFAVAANDLKARMVVLKTTNDGGATWQSLMLSRSVGGINYFIAQNAALAYDGKGELYVVYTVGNLNDFGNALAICHSADGQSFSAPIALSSHGAADKIIDSRPVIAFGANNNAHVAWDSYAIATHHFSIKIASQNQGFFAPAITVGNEGSVSAPALAISKTGTVYLAWNDWGFSSQPPFYNSGGRLLFSASSNNGKSFSAPIMIAATNVGFARKIAAMPDAGVSANITLAADPNKDGVIYAAFTAVGKGLDIFFVSSINGGKSWSAAKKINNDAGSADQFHPALAIDSNSGLYVSFYDTRQDANNRNVNLYLARSRDRGASFDNVLITGAASNDSVTNAQRDFTANLGERIGIAATNGQAIMTWTDTRQGSEDIFLNILSFGTATSPGEIKIDAIK